MSLKSYKIVLFFVLILIIGSIAYFYQFNKEIHDIQECVLTLIVSKDLKSTATISTDLAPTVTIATDSKPCQKQVACNQDQNNQNSNSVENFVPDTSAAISVVIPKKVPYEIPQFLPFALRQGHGFKQLDTTIFYTPEDRKELFYQLGIEYVNDHVIEYAEVLHHDARTSEYYLNNVQYNDALTNLYADDIARHILISLSIRWINKEIGYGVFAEEDVPAGKFIGIYGGVVKDPALFSNKDYAWFYPGKTLKDNNISIDAAEKGNELRFINDGKDSNCITAYVIGYDHTWYVCYVAQKDIKNGEQLLVNYGSLYWENRKHKYRTSAI